VITRTTLGRSAAASELAKIIAAAQSPPKKFLKDHRPVARMHLGGGSGGASVLSLDLMILSSYANPGMN
jgi:hypothetical protein